MNTPSHLLISAAAQRTANQHGANLPLSAVLWGSVLPDIPLVFLSMGMIFYYRVILGETSDSLAHTMFHKLYFTDPLWLSFHNVLHSPFTLGIYIFLLHRWRNKVGSWQHWLFWFFISSGLHAGLDILTHFDDGPLLLWPLNWSLRFNSPISYWDPLHYGRIFMVFELLLDAILLGYLLIPKIRTFNR